MLQISALVNCGSVQSTDLPGVMSYAVDVDFCVHCSTKCLAVFCFVEIYLENGG